MGNFFGKFRKMSIRILFSRTKKVLKNFKFQINFFPKLIYSERSILVCFLNKKKRSLIDNIENIDNII